MTGSKTGVSKAKTVLDSAHCRSLAKPSCVNRALVYGLLGHKNNRSIPILNCINILRLSCVINYILIQCTIFAGHRGFVNEQGVR